MEPVPKIKFIPLLLTLLSLLLIEKNSMSSINIPRLLICYSSSKEYKLIVSPSFCKEDMCLTLDEIDSLDNNIDEEFLSQTLFVYQKVNENYILVRKQDISKDKIYLDNIGTSYFISNDGNVIVAEDKYSLKWNVFRLDESMYKLTIYRGEVLFNLKQKEYERCLEELHGYVTEIKGVSKISTKVKKSIRIKFRYFDIHKDGYIRKKTDIEF